MNLYDCSLLIRISHCPFKISAWLLQWTERICVLSGRECRISKGTVCFSTLQWKGWSTPLLSRAWKRRDKFSQWNSRGNMRWLRPAAMLHCDSRSFIVSLYQETLRLNLLKTCETKHFLCGIWRLLLCLTWTKVGCAMTASLSNIINTLHAPFPTQSIISYGFSSRLMIPQNEESSDHTPRASPTYMRPQFRG